MWYKLISFSCIFSSFPSVKQEKWNDFVYVSVNLDVCACIYLLPGYHGRIVIIKKCRAKNLIVNILRIFYFQILMTKFENWLSFIVSFFP